MKKKSIISLLYLSIIFGLLMGCQSKSDQKTVTSTSATTSEQTSTETTTSSSDSKTEISEAETDLNLSNMQQIGQDGYGYVYIPKTWHPFQDINGGSTYQYSDAIGYNVITMFSYSKEDLKAEKIDDTVVEQASNSYYYTIQDTDYYNNLSGAMTEVSGYKAYQIYASTKTDGKLLCSWFFRTGKSDKVYLVTLEGDEETFSSLLPYIQATWSEIK